MKTPRPYGFFVFNTALILMFVLIGALFVTAIARKTSPDYTTKVVADVIFEGYGATYVAEDGSTCEVYIGNSGAVAHKGDKLKEVWSK